jgi:p-hydroxybenzoate 3-monooxygenase
MFEQWGLGDVLQGFPANNFLEIRVDGRSRPLAEDLPGLETAGKTVPQQALVRGRIAALLADGGDLRFEVPDVGLRQLGTSRPVVAYTDQDGLAHETECDFVAGCDGDRGVSAASVPAGALTVHTYDYGAWWLTVLADSPAPKHALMTTGERGFAAQFAERMRITLPSAGRSEAGGWLRCASDEV